MASDDRRRNKRFGVARDSLAHWDGRRQACCLQDISACGALFECDILPPLGAAVEVNHPSLGQLSGTVVRHMSDGFALEFEPEERTVLYALKAITLSLTDETHDGLVQAEEPR